jgi:hypothetical protein
VYSPTADIVLLLAASRELLSRDNIENIDVERLVAWGTERSAIFVRWREHTALGSAEQVADESLLGELLDVDAQIRRRLLECQTRLGQQITAVGTKAQALPYATSSRRLLERVV